MACETKDSLNKDQFDAGFDSGVGIKMATKVILVNGGVVGACHRRTRQAERATELLV